MGLARVRKIIDNHGGKIWVESEGENKGATFTIELPIMKKNVGEKRKRDENGTEENINRR